MLVSISDNWRWVSTNAEYVQVLSVDPCSMGVFCGTKLWEWKRLPRQRNPLCNDSFSENLSFLGYIKKNGHSSLFFNSGNLFHLIPPGVQVVPGIEKLTWMEHKLETQKFNWWEPCTSYWTLGSSGRQHAHKGYLVNGMSQDFVMGAYLLWVYLRCIKESSMSVMAHPRRNKVCWCIFTLNLYQYQD